MLSALLASRPADALFDAYELALFDLKFRTECAAGGVGPSNRRHSDGIDSTFLRATGDLHDGGLAAAGGARLGGARPGFHQMAGRAVARGREAGRVAQDLHRGDASARARSHAP